MLIASEASFLFPLQELSFCKVHLQKLTELQILWGKAWEQGRNGRKRRHRIMIRYSLPGV